MIKQAIFCVFGSLAFAINMNAPKRSIKYIFIASTVSAIIERFLSSIIGDFLACLLAMLVISLFSEIVARQVKMPSTIILMPSTIPLLPGSAIYYTMLHLISKSSEAVVYASATILAGLGIALGAVISSIITSLIFKRH